MNEHCLFYIYSLIKCNVVQDNDIASYASWMFIINIFVIYLTLINHNHENHYFDISDYTQLSLLCTYRF